MWSWATRPWQSGLSDAAESFLADRDLSVPDRQLAMAFLYAGAAHTNEGGVLGFLLPSKSLLHNRSGPAVQMRKEILTTLGVDVVLDLSAIRRDVFNSAVAPAGRADCTSGERCCDDRRQRLAAHCSAPVTAAVKHRRLRCLPGRCAARPTQPRC